eukprot:tig00001729_g9737.t1
MPGLVAAETHPAVALRRRAIAALVLGPRVGVLHIRAPAGGLRASNVERVRQRRSRAPILLWHTCQPLGKLVAALVANVDPLPELVEDFEALLYPTLAEAHPLPVWSTLGQSSCQRVQHKGLEGDGHLLFLVVGATELLTLCQSNGNVVLRTVNSGARTTTAAAASSWDEFWAKMDARRQQKSTRAEDVKEGTPRGSLYEVLSDEQRAPDSLETMGISEGGGEAASGTKGEEGARAVAEAETARGDATNQSLGQESA